MPYTVIKTIRVNSKTVGQTKVSNPVRVTYFKKVFKMF